VIPLLLDGLAAYRLTRLVTADTILDGPRDAVVRLAYGMSGSTESARKTSEAHGIYVDYSGAWAEVAQQDPNAPKLATLVTCRWCSGMYVSLLVVAARRFAPRAWHPLSTALAFSAVAALMARLEDE
jgi:hypothetical protein